MLILVDISWYQSQKAPTNMSFQLQKELLNEVTRGITCKNVLWQYSNMWFSSMWSKLWGGKGENKKIGGGKGENLFIGGGKGGKSNKEGEKGEKDEKGEKGEKGEEVGGAFLEAFHSSPSHSGL